MSNFFINGRYFRWILFSNVGVFLFLQVALLILFFLKNDALVQEIEQGWFLSSYSNPGELLRRPWTVLTHMFTHVQFLHFLFNMMVLFFSGQLFQHHFGDRRLPDVYLLGGLSGFLFFFLAYNIFPVFNSVSSVVMGASASVMAVLTASAVKDPKMKVRLIGVFEVEIIWVALALVAMDLISIRGGQNSGGHIGHIGGAIFGFIYTRYIFRSGKNMGWIDSLIGAISRLLKRNPKMKTVHRRPVSDEEFNTRRKENQKRVDLILDKISRGGYDSLTKEEKEFLFRNSQK
jgi:membrane associated rhomboid family serine protease